MDKLALKIKNLLRQQGVRPDSVTAVFSSEKATRKLATLSGEQRENPDAFGAVPQFRLRVIPVLGTMPAIFGQAMAAKVMTDIAGCPLAYACLAQVPCVVRPLASLALTCTSPPPGRRSTRASRHGAGAAS